MGVAICRADSDGDGSAGASPYPAAGRASSLPSAATLFRLRKKLRNVTHVVLWLEWLSTDEHQYDDVRGKGFLAQARRERRAYPSWVCEERATKPAAKRTAAQRVALCLAWGVVARRLQPHLGDAPSSRLAPGQT
jgi:hypothetical protein